MKKLVMRVDLEDDKAKQKAMKTVSSLQGIDLIAMDMKEHQMTVIGAADPVRVVSKLRKYWQVAIITLGPVKEPEKEEPKPAAAAAPTAEEGKKEEGKKEEGKKEEGKEEGKKEEGKGAEKKEEGGGGGDGGKKEEGGGGGGKKDNGEAAPKKLPPTMLQPIRPYNPYMVNYPPYMATANPYTNHPQMHNQPSYYVQSVEENPNGCTIL